MASTLSIYSLLLWHINSQWVDIWFEDGTTATESEWTKSEGYFYFNYATSDLTYDNACATDTCILFWPWDPFLNQYIYRTTDISSYSQLRVKYDLTTYEMEASDACQISYAYDTETAKTLAESIVPNDPSTLIYRYTDQYSTFPSAINKNTIWIWLETTVNHDVGGTKKNDNDLCFWDNIYLQGMLATTAPTKAPTYKPTNAPTNNPNTEPTKNPIAEPTISPTKAPYTEAPTLSPDTFAPTLSPDTFAPSTKAPTLSPNTYTPSHAFAPTDITPVASYFSTYTTNTQTDEETTSDNVDSDETDEKSKESVADMMEILIIAGSSLCGLLILFGALNACLTVRQNKKAAYQLGLQAKSVSNSDPTVLIVVKSQDESNTSVAKHAVVYSGSRARESPIVHVAQAAGVEPKAALINMQALHVSSDMVLNNVMDDRTNEVPQVNEGTMENEVPQVNEGTMEKHEDDDDDVLCGMQTHETGDNVAEQSASENDEEIPVPPPPPPPQPPQRPQPPQPPQPPVAFAYQ